MKQVETASITQKVDGNPLINLNDRFFSLVIIASTSSVLMPGSFRSSLPISATTGQGDAQILYEQSRYSASLHQFASPEIEEETEISVLPDTDQVLTVEPLADMLEKNSYPDEQPEFDLSFDPDDYPLA